METTMETNLIPNPALHDMDKANNQYDVTDGDKADLAALQVPVPICECERLKIIREARLIETPAEETYDRYASIASRVFKVPIALISLMEVNKQWFKAKVGLDVKETHRNVAFCAYTILESSPSVMVVTDALEDVRFKENPLVLGPPFIRFYAGASLIVEGIKIGTLCIIDTVPRKEFGMKEMKMLLDIASIISQLIAERRSKVLRIEYDIAQINLSVLYSLKYPLEHVTSLSSPMQTIYKAMKLACHNDPEALRNEKTLMELQNTLKKFSTEMDTFHQLVELCLKVASSLLDVNQISINDTPPSTKKQSKLLSFDLQKLMAKVRVVVMKSNPNCKLDWNMIEDVVVTPSKTAMASNSTEITTSTASLSSKPRPTSGSSKKDSVEEAEEAFVMSIAKVQCFSHPDILVLLLISMVSYLSRKDREVNSIVISTEEHGKLVSMTDKQVAELVGEGVVNKAITTAESSAEAPQLPEDEAAATATTLANYWYHGDFVITLESREANAKLPSDHFELGQEEDQYELIALRNILVWIGGKMTYSLTKDGEGVKYVIHLPCAMEMPTEWMDKLVVNPDLFHGIQARYISKTTHVHATLSKHAASTPSETIQTDSSLSPRGQNQSYFHSFTDLAKGLWKTLLHGSTSGSSASVHPMTEEELRLSNDTTDMDDLDMDVIRTLPEPVTEKQVLREFHQQDKNCLQHAQAVSGGVMSASSMSLSSNQEISTSSASQAFPGIEAMPSSANVEKSSEHS